MKNMSQISGGRGTGRSEHKTNKEGATRKDYGIKNVPAVNVRITTLMNDVAFMVLQHLKYRGKGEKRGV